MLNIGTGATKVVQRGGCSQNMNPTTGGSKRKRPEGPQDEGTARGKRAKVVRKVLCFDAGKEPGAVVEAEAEGATGVRRRGCIQKPTTKVSKRKRTRESQGEDTTEGKRRKALPECEVGMEPGAVAEAEAEAEAPAQEARRASAHVLDPFVIEDGELGKGGFGRVMLGRDTTNGDLVAIKELPAGSERQHSAVARREAAILCRLLDGGKAHPHIVGIRGYFERDDKHYIVMEACLGGELFGKVAKGGLSEEAGGALFAQLVAGLQHIHACGVAHLDLKLENVLVTDDGQLKIAG